MKRSTPEQKKAKQERLLLVKGKPPAKKTGVKKPVKRKEPVPSVATLDRLFSLYIRRHGECQLWGYWGVQCSSVMQCSHIKSRRFHSVRWDVGNAICVCSGHHLRQHLEPDANYRALVDLLGESHLDDLQDRFNEGKKLTPDDKRALAKWLREQLKRHDAP